MYCKKVTKVIDKNRERIVHDTKLLNSLLKKLSPEENLQYGYDMGFIEEPDYLLAKQEMEDKKNEKNKP